MEGAVKGGALLISASGSDVYGDRKNIARPRPVSLPSNFQQTNEAEVMKLMSPLILMRWLLMG